MKERIKRLKLNNTGRIFAFLLIANLLIGGEILRELGLIDYWCGYGDVCSFWTQHRIDFERTWAFWGLNIIFIGGIFMFGTMSNSVDNPEDSASGSQD